MAFSSKMLVSSALACILVVLTLNPGLGKGAAGRSRISPAPVQEVAAPARPGTSIPYIGLRGCSASACHGQDDRAPGDSIWQNEYQTWATEDKHSNAFLLLYNENSRAMGQRLGLGNPVEENRCLACHSINPDNQEADFDISEGVSCEACHGPASGWVNSHYTRGHTRAQSLDEGMFDTKDLVRRTEICISCHVGSPRGNVDHELISAGHPDLVFEVEALSDRMPRHWQGDSQDWEGARLWLIGQALTLKETLDQLQRRYDPSHWYGVDFADLECSACHHSLLVPSPRQQRGYSGRPGLPLVDPSAYIVWRQVGSIVLADESDSLRTEMEELMKALEGFGVEDNPIEENVEQISRTLDRLVSRFSSIELDRRLVSEFIGAISNDSERIAQAGIRSAQQATLAVESLYASIRSSTGTSDPEMEMRIGQLHELLEEFSPRQFSEELGRVGIPALSQSPPLAVRG